MRYKDYTCEIVLENGSPVYEYKPLSTHDQRNNETFIEGRHNTAYKIKFTNHTSQRVLIVPSVDGLSVFDGKIATQNSQGYIVAAFGDIEIPGWTLDNKSVAKFVFGTKHNSYAKQGEVDGAENNVGVIGIAVFKEDRQSYAQMLLNLANRQPRYDDYYDCTRYGGWVGGGGIPYYNGLVGGAGGCGTLGGGISKGFDTTVYGSSVGGADASIGCSVNLNSISTYAAPEPHMSMGTEFGAQTEFQTTTTTFDRDVDSVQYLIVYYDTLYNLKLRGIDTTPPKPRLGNLPKPFGDMGCNPPANWRK
jgi:hypothetical protein